MRKRGVNFNLVQVGVWLVVYLLLLIYYVRERDTLVRGILASTINLSVSLMAIYAQSHLLVPRFLKSKWKFFFASVVVLMALVVIKTVVDQYVFNQILSSKPYQFSLHHTAITFLTIFLCFIIGFLMRISLDHVKLLKHQEMLHHQQLVSEINLLKAQVQPHFMFNTLNNIYSLAFRKSDQTAEVVARLSDIMRYFVHEGPREKVSVRTEIKFIESYIELERIRMASPLILDFKIRLTNEDIEMPPMLFIPFIENYFKHGLDKRKKENRLMIELLENDKILQFRMENEVQQHTPEIIKGVGLDNIHRRLELLYGQKFTLTVGINNNIFCVSMIIPIEYADPMFDR